MLLKKEHPHVIVTVTINALCLHCRGYTLIMATTQAPKSKFLILKQNGLLLQEVSVCYRYRIKVQCPAVLT